MSLSVALKHGFGDFTVDVNFSAAPGITVLYGPSGSGKTTALNAVAGLFRADFAKISLNGVALADSDTGVFLPPHKRRLGVVFQDGRLFPHLSVHQNLRYGSWFARHKDRANERAVVEMLGLGKLLNRSPATLSGGERQRVAIGRALLSNPRAILADEPLSALDDARKAEILPYFERLRDELRVPMLYVSHSAAEVARLATTVVMFKAGRVQSIGSPAEVLINPALADLGRDAGAVFSATVVAHHADGVTELAAGGASFYLPTVDARIGNRITLRTSAAEVMLARGNPEGLSALNMLPGVVDKIETNGGVIFVRLNTAAGPILAQITQRSANALRVKMGAELTAVIKSLAYAPQDIGSPRAIEKPPEA